MPTPTSLPLLLFLYLSLRSFRVVFSSIVSCSVDAIGHVTLLDTGILGRSEAALACGSACF